jgi:hypothetical protein
MEEQFDDSMRRLHVGSYVIFSLFIPASRYEVLKKFGFAPSSNHHITG